MQLGFGIAFPDLYEREGLIKVDRAFLAFLAEADRALAEKLAAARANPPSGLAESQLLIALAPHVEDFITRLFGMEREARGLAERIERDGPSCVATLRATAGAAHRLAQLVATLIEHPGAAFAELAGLGGTPGCATR
jgi:hypothetical protein